jgi:hypothetical protein
VAFDTKSFSEILSARESVSMSRSPGGIALLLGLAGTFYGLMLAVSTAGSLLDATNSSITLSAINVIFSSMKGIFGTSFCGMIGALMLNSTHAIVSGRKMAYMADVEEYTQFILLPAFAPKGDNSEELRRNALVEQMSLMVSSLQNNMTMQMTKAVDSLAENLEIVTRTSLERVEKAELGVLEKLETIHQRTADGLRNSIADSLSRAESLQKQTAQGLEAAIASAMERVESATKQLVSQQTETSKEQWSSAIETVRVAMLQNVEQGKTAVASVMNVADQVAVQGREAILSLLSVGGQVNEQGKAALDSMQSIAYKVSEQADQRATSLAENVGTQLEQLSRDVQSSFTVLAQASRELVDSQRVLLDEIEKRQVRERELTEGLNSGIGEAGVLMRINQSEFQASLDLFRHGVEALLEKFTGGSAEQESQRTFIDQLHATLEAFSEKTSEVLVENAMRTQEILLEVLEQSRLQASSPAPSGEVT